MVLGFFLFVCLFVFYIFLKLYNFKPWPEDVGLLLKTFNLLQVWNEYSLQLLFVNTAERPQFNTVVILLIMIEEVLQFLIG